MEYGAKSYIGVGVGNSRFYTLNPENANFENNFENIFENVNKSKCVCHSVHIENKNLSPYSIVNETPSLPSKSTPAMSLVHYREITILKETTLLQDIKTPEMLISEWEKSAIHRSSYTDNFDDSQFYQNEGLTSTLLFQKYISKVFKKSR